MKFQCSFKERIRLLQLIGGFVASGIPQLRECSRLLDVVGFSDEEAAPIKLVVDVSKDHILWDETAVQELQPKYDLELTSGTTHMLLGILEKANLSPLADLWILNVVDGLKEQLPKP